jgi:hypothetical protein
MRITSSLTLAALLLGLGSARLAAEEVAATENVRTNFAPGAVLSPDEVRQVVSLAHQCGINPVATVRTDYVHPSSIKLIYVIGAERKEGRNVFTIGLTITRRQWSGPPEKPLKSLGDFSADAHGLYTNHITLFMVADRTIRVQLSGDVPLPDADKIVPALVKADFRYRDEKLKAKLQGIDFSEPFGLATGLRKGSYSMAHSCGGSDSTCLMIIEFTFEDNRVTIVSVEMMVS